jgi:hypothetical protein
VRALGRTCSSSISLSSSIEKNSGLTLLTQAFFDISDDKNLLPYHPDSAMPLIRQAISFTSDKVSNAVANHHHKADSQSNLPQEPGNSNHSDSLDRQNDQALEPRHSTESVELARYRGTQNPQQQSKQQWSPYPREEPSDKLTSTQPAVDQIQDPQQTIPDNTFGLHVPASDVPPSQTTEYHDPRQHRPSTEEGRASEDRNRADFYQAKYYEAQQAQANQYQGQSMQNQYGDDGMGGYQQNGWRGGRGGGRGMGRRGRGGLIGMLINR